MLLALALVAVLAACETAAPAATTPSPSSPTSSSPTPSAASELKVAYMRDLSPEGALAATTPAHQAVELAFAGASLEGADGPVVEVILFDTQGDPGIATEAADEVAADPAFVAAIAGPDLAGQAALAEILGEAGVPLLSLSARDAASTSQPGTWLRLVASVEEQAIALARAATAMKQARLGVCLVAAAPDGSAFARRVERSVVDPVVVQEGDVAGIEEAGCGVVLWTGDAAGGAGLAVALVGLEQSPRLVGDAALREPLFLEEAGDAAEEVRSVCSCTDVSTSLDLAAQRFIQDFQSQYGSPPGPYAVEAWDGAHLLLRGLRETEGREALVSWLAGISTFEGLGGTYAVRGGELSDPQASMHVYRVEGGRWILTSAPDPR